jgi:hypothetical protein
VLHILINSDSRVCLYIVLFFLEISIPAYLKSSMEWPFELKCIETGLSYFLNVHSYYITIRLTLYLSCICRTSNVVYAVHCKKCKHIVYVGETETMLKDRIQNHLSDIRTFKVAKHKLLRDTKKTTRRHNI